MPCAVTRESKAAPKFLDARADKAYTRNAFIFVRWYHDHATSSNKASFLFSYFIDVNIFQPAIPHLFILLSWHKLLRHFRQLITYLEWHSWNRKCFQYLHCHRLVPDNLWLLLSWFGRILIVSIPSRITSSSNAFYLFGHFDNALFDTFCGLDISVDQIWAFMWKAVRFRCRYKIAVFNFLHVRPQDTLTAFLSAWFNTLNQLISCLFLSMKHIFR